MDIVVRLRQGIDPNDMVETEKAMDSGADTIEFLRTEIVRLEFNHGQARALEAQNKDLMAEVDRLGDSLNKCHEQMMRRTDGPVHGPELERSLLAGGRYRTPECGGFQGFED